MKKWFNQRRLLVIVSVLLMFSVVGNVFAASNLEKITAHLNHGIMILLNGEEFHAIDEVTGEKLVPITYKSRTYMPLRSVAEASGVEVGWDGETQTVTLDNEKAVEDGYVRVTSAYTLDNSEDYYRLKSKEPKILNRGLKSDFEFGYAHDSLHAYSLSLQIDNSSNFDTFKTTIWLEDSEESALQRAASIEIINMDTGIDLVTEMELGDLEFGKHYEFEINIKDMKRILVRTNGVLSVIGEPMLGKK